MSQWRRIRSLKPKTEPRSTVPGGSTRPEKQRQPTAVEMLRLAGQRAMFSVPRGYEMKHLFKRDEPTGS